MIHIYTWHISTMHLNDQISEGLFERKCLENKFVFGTIDIRVIGPISCEHVSLLTIWHFKKKQKSDSKSRKRAARKNQLIFSLWSTKNRIVQPLLKVIILNGRIVSLVTKCIILVVIWILYLTNANWQRGLFGMSNIWGKVAILSPNLLSADSFLAPHSTRFENWPLLK